MKRTHLAIALAMAMGLLFVATGRALSPYFLCLRKQMKQQGLQL